MAGENSLVLYDCKIIFRNFAGREREFNSEGDRNFSVLIKPDLAEKLNREGWNVKQLKPREEGEEGDWHLKVKVNYKKGRPPRCVLVTSRGQTELGADQVEIIDAADLAKVDLMINGYPYDVNDRKGISAYLKSIFVTINEDPLEQMYGLAFDAQSPSDDLEAVDD